MNRADLQAIAGFNQAVNAFARQVQAEKQLERQQLADQYRREMAERELAMKKGEFDWRKNQALRADRVKAQQGIYDDLHAQDKMREDARRWQAEYALRQQELDGRYGKDDHSRALTYANMTPEQRLIYDFEMGDMSAGERLNELEYERQQASRQSSQAQAQNQTFDYFTKNVLQTKKIEVEEYPTLPDGSPDYSKTPRTVKKEVPYLSLNGRVVEGSPHQLFQMYQDFIAETQARNTPAVDRSMPIPPKPPQPLTRQDDQQPDQPAKPQEPSVLPGGEVYQPNVPEYPSIWKDIKSAIAIDPRIQAEEKSKYLANQIQKYQNRYKNPLWQSTDYLGISDPQGRGTDIAQLANAYQKELEKLGLKAGSPEEMRLLRARSLVEENTPAGYPLPY